MKKKGRYIFRVIEHKYLKEIIDKEEDFILALGGGTPCYGNNMQEVNTGNTVSIYLEGTTATMIEID